ncbi:glutamate-5-semialdehyde dehydrogenase [Synechococcus sp. PCC 7502]|uniref:glutamate-5-semialdehyde dehydrogenase n=1 Tax=Synechococcus sp. PCC 7502 TaxID=1173263 RepID=UPI00029FEF2B|nr:glutamate-5-semialdehyde dehydrogenase [Synechococcus sp. PCC 7502]AFY72476.1 glutamate-5-semialdehyde dehydrogenase [Synechococcus sp. PCC 7502]
MRSLLETVQITKSAARSLAKLDHAAKNSALEAIADAVNNHADQILEANAQDVENAVAANLAAPLISRLKLNPNKVKAMAVGVRDVARLSDPTGIRQIHRELDTGLILERITCPLGVLGVIFEARPDAVTQIAALAIKSGNGVLLKGGSEAVLSCEAIAKIIHKALQTSAVAPEVVQLLTTRSETMEILKMDRHIDLIIPRGSNDFVRFIQANTNIPVLGHADGICHLYVDQTVDIDQAVAIAVDSKTQYPSACNAIETLLIHRAIAPEFLAKVIPALQAQNVELRGCDQTLSLYPDLIPATETDWATEYCDLILSIKIVDSLESAIDHINTFGSKHTEAIATTNPEVATIFASDVDAAGVYHNCSTRFADGFRYGFGAEVGISTQKMPPRGPVGLEGLVTYKYHLQGHGQIVADYSGSNPKSFIHRDI